MTDAGTYRAYKVRRFNQKQGDLIDRCNAIIEEYEGAGYAMSLRQLYYQLVARNVIPNNANAYSNLGNLVSEARMAGLVSWTAIEDRGRYLQGLETQVSPKEAMKRLRSDYRRDLWEDQPCRVEVRCEKQALEGVVSHICAGLRVSFTSLKGYSSQSETWRAGRRYAGYIQRGQRPVVLYLGDHDPSGIDMTKDQRERLALFAGIDIEVVRVALNMDQVRRLSLPPNYAKDTDSRYEGYRAQYGEECWELDALPPDGLHREVERAVLAFRDESRWAAAQGREAHDLDELDSIIEDMA